MRLAACLVIGLGFAAPSARAEEGMWTFDNFPAAKMAKEHGWAPDEAWLSRVRTASARLETGCSAAIVSASGLMQTNHHCVLDCVQAFSTPDKDSVRLGFRAKGRIEERRCAAYAAEVLTNVSDVTATVRAATHGKTGAAFSKARDAAVAKIESDCKGEVADKTCQVASLYQGGRYALHAFRRYEDVRLVFAPELDAAFFGGDPDNFNFPRYAFDVAFLRLYENGQPALTPDYLPWRSAPLQESESVLISGNPGGTSRQMSAAQLAFQRDHFLPWRLQTLGELRGRVIRFSQESPEHARIAADFLFGLENSFKALSGRRAALVTPGMLEAKAKDEAALSEGKPEVAAAFRAIALAVETDRKTTLPYQYVEARFGQGSELLHHARTLVRAATERAKPNAMRLPAYTDARLATLQAGLLAERPIDRELEALTIAFWASKMREYLTADDPLTKLALGAESPERLAARISSESKLGDAAERRRLFEGGLAAVRASRDPAIVLALKLEPEARKMLDRRRAEVDAPIAAAQQTIAEARFAAYGASLYPDATFSPRLTYGRVAGWTEPSGRKIAPFTRFAGLFARATGAEPFALAPSWAAAKKRLRANTIFNVSTSNDIIGGNSGSPLIDREGRVAGAVFDGNIHSLGGDYFYDPALNRTVAVASTGVEEGLVKVYGMDALVSELKRGR